MLNVCFSESAMGTLKFAFHKYVHDHQFKVICIPDDLSVGNIDNIKDFASRKNTLVTLFGDEKYVETYCKSRYKEFFDEIYNHKEITIWYGNSPFEFCGFLYTIWLLRDKPITLRRIYCSRTLERDSKTYVTYKSVAELDAEEIQRFLLFAEKISNKEIKDYAKLWEKLSFENGVLRIYKGFTIVTADISYYDEIFLKHISYIPTQISKVIGRILGDEELGIGDGLIANRIKEMVSQGILKQDGDDKIFFKNSIWKTN